MLFQGLTYFMCKVSQNPTMIVVVKNYSWNKICHSRVTNDP